ncbi:hypothetical protein, partial [Nocardia cyriacigeorgica]|uniref:hypothetical protein n=1 Tax=Nocardia cyriacigeorgica TaxID=135487 RepID=UPI003CC7D748
MSDPAPTAAGRAAEPAGSRRPRLAARAGAAMLRGDQPCGCGRCRGGWTAPPSSADAHEQLPHVLTDQQTLERRHHLVEA